MKLEEIQDEGHRKFMNSLFGALKEDFPDKSFELSLAYSEGEGAHAGWFVRPRFVVWDMLKSCSISVLEIGDGVLEPTSMNKGRKSQEYYLQLRGIPETEPWDLMRVEDVNKNYFSDGKKARKVLVELGYEGLLGD